MKLILSSKEKEEKIAEKLFNNFIEGIFKGWE